MRREAAGKRGTNARSSAVAAVLEAALAMRDICVVVAAGVVLQDLKRLAPIQPSPLERRDQ
jgi:hypothetical protein